MIMYELATQLQKVGLPQGGNGIWIGSPEKLSWRSWDRVYVPTLAELIEACGDEFRSLENMGRLPRSTIEEEWVSFGRNIEGIFWGQTPEEAIAHLYLALHKKM